MSESPVPEPFTLSSPAPVDSREIGGVTVPESLQAGGKGLVLNGAGVRTKFSFTIYVGALYLPQKCDQGSTIIQQDEPMAIRLHIVSDKVTPENMEAALREGFEKSTGGKADAMAEEINTLVPVFNSGIKVGDIYDFKYIPGKGVEAHKNDELITVTPGLPFKAALFGIWLSDDPVQNPLKNGMLGKG